ncbi:MAG: family 10 glycosylhydrolase [Cyanobacteria bacterium P01_H01_bin.119]
MSKGELLKTERIKRPSLFHRFLIAGMGAGLTTFTLGLTQFTGQVRAVSAATDSTSLQGAEPSEFVPSAIAAKPEDEPEIAADAGPSGSPEPTSAIDLEISPDSGLLTVPGQQPTGTPSAEPLRSPSSPAPEPSLEPSLDAQARPPLSEMQRSQILLQNSSTSSDPADQAQPPGLSVQPGNDPISPFLALAMRQELDRLTGRFESAYLQAASADQPNRLRLATTATPVLTASRGLTEVATAPEATLHPVLLEAEQLMRDWRGLIERQAYGEARDRWLSVRQSLWDNFPLDQNLTQPEIRAMWLDRGTIVAAGSPQRLAQIFDRLQAAGINTVFFETVNAGYPVYPSAIAPAQNPLTHHWDPLETAVELARERNMQIHAWLWTFAAGNQRHNEVLNLPANYPGPLLEANPHWAAYDNQGNMIPRGQTKPFLDPANREVRRYLLSIVNEVITNYDVDGIQLDYIRYPFQDPSADRTYGYGLAARQEFQRLTGIDPIQLSPRDRPEASATERARNRELWNRWMEFRIQQVNSFVSDVSRLVRYHDPDLILSTAVFPIATHERLQKIQQDWETWANRGDVDWVVLMSYALDTNRLQRLTRPWLVSNNFNATLIIPSIRLLNLSDPAAIDQIQALRDLPAAGYALFASANLDADLAGALNRIQGSSDAINSPLPQQSPYESALARYQALQREWNLLLANGRIIMDSRSLNQWITDANLLETALQDLAESPSQRNLSQVQARIAQLQSDLLSGSIALRSASSSYRITTWQNRLTTLERLIIYGQQRQ